jgi:uncharacterized protein (DUF2237 family)
VNPPGLDIAGVGSERDAVDVTRDGRGVHPSSEGLTSQTCRDAAEALRTHASPTAPGRPHAEQESTAAHDGGVAERNVLGADLQPCSVDPITGFFRDGSCRTGPQDLGSHTICAVVTAEFLDHQRSIGNDLTTPRPQYPFPGLAPGDRWCVTAVRARR